MDDDDKSRLIDLDQRLLFENWIVDAVLLYDLPFDNYRVQCNKIFRKKLRKEKKATSSNAYK